MIFQIPAPVQGQIGLGDAIKKMIQATTNIKPCGSCEDRAEALNEKVQFVPFEAWLRGE